MEAKKRKAKTEKKVAAKKPKKVAPVIIVGGIKKLDPNRKLVPNPDVTFYEKDPLTQSRYLHI